jgi:hypothetical protein
MITGRAVSASLLHHYRRVVVRRAVNHDFAGARPFWGPCRVCVIESGSTVQHADQRVVRLRAHVRAVACPRQSRGQRNSSDCHLLWLIVPFAQNVLQKPKRLLPTSPFSLMMPAFGPLRVETTVA